MPTSLSSTRPSTPLSTLSTTAIKDGHRGRQTALRMDSYASNLSSASTRNNYNDVEAAAETGGYEDDVEPGFSDDDGDDMEGFKTRRGLGNGAGKKGGESRIRDDEGGNSSGGGGIDGVSAITDKSGIVGGSHVSHEEEQALERTRLRLLGGLEPRAGGFGRDGSEGKETPVTEEAKEEMGAAKGVSGVVAEGGSAGMVDTSGEKV